MSNLSQTAANVVASAGAKIRREFNFGATIVAGTPCYIDPADNKAKAGDSSALATANAIFLALNGGANGQPAALLEEGDVNLGATLVVGETYILSADPGAIAPVADISTNYVTILGVAKSASILAWKPIFSGVARAA